MLLPTVVCTEPCAVILNELAIRDFQPSIFFADEFQALSKLLNFLLSRGGDLKIFDSLEFLPSVAVAKILPVLFVWRDTVS